MNFFKNFFKRDTTFFVLLNQQADFIVEAASQFNDMFSDFDNASNYVKKIDDLEHDADLVRHQFSSKIDSAFITPMDKEDLTSLADKLDDVIDCIEATAGRISIYDIRTAREDIKPMAENMFYMTQNLQFAVKSLGESKNRNAIHGTFIEIHTIENQTDEMFRSALGTLFKDMRNNPVEIMIWKEIYDRIERAVDRAEDAANIIESMVVKYA
mgnify:CR=1 FL=1